MANQTALVIVESPAKAGTIKKYLGSGFSVEASVGHIKDLPKSDIGVDVEHDFKPRYDVIRGKGELVKRLKKLAKAAGMVYLAPDPDREGEAIAWHIREAISSPGVVFKRVLFNEITKRGITDALKKPGDLDPHMYDSQQARRVLDRLVGYKISPLLWDKVRRGLSAGRVQSVAVRIVVEREREIGAFTPVEYWSVLCQGTAATPPPLRLRVVRWKGKKAEIRDQQTAAAIAAEIEHAGLKVDSVERKERKRYPLPPFITSKLQQEAARKLRFTAKKTMAVAQRLYEGIELGDEGAVGLITYMRTDSTRLSQDAVAEARTYIAQRYGADSVPEEPIAYKSKKGAQDAHEAIRPTSMKYEPEAVRRLLFAAASKDGEKQRDAEDYFRLYQLIWNRFVACQMRPAVYDQTIVDVAAGKAGLRATGQVLRFAGFTAVYEESPDEVPAQVPNGDDEREGEGERLPEVREGEKLTLGEVKTEQHFTQPPPRFTEALLVKELEEKGIGRPSTYANILSTVQERGYVEKREGRFVPTTLGTRVNDLLVAAFPDIFDVTFTAQMETDLDRIADGEDNWVRVMRRFYDPFSADLDKAKVEMKDLKREEIPTDHVCEKCGSPMVIKWGRNGEFLACSKYPDCKNTKEFTRTEEGEIKIAPPPTTDEVCDVCGKPMLVKRGRFGEFLACSGYPECKTTRAISLGVDCPKCGGFLTAKRSKRGKVFYGCSNYAKTKCDFVSWDRPVPTPCPQCGAKFLIQKETRKGPRLRCHDEACGYVQGAAEAEADAE